MISHYTLTKKTFLAGAQCLKRMWWEMYDASAPETRQTLTTRFRMEEGAKVGMLARTYVPGGTLIKRGGRSLNAILADSREAIADERVPAIYECAVIANNTLVFPDILERVDNGFVLIEVKSKTSVSEQKHIPDVAIQAHVLRSAGIPIVRCEIMHLNRDCVYPDLSNLFTRVDVTELVDARLETIAERCVCRWSPRGSRFCPRSRSGRIASVPIPVPSSIAAGPSLRRITSARFTKSPRRCWLSLKHPAGRPSVICPTM